MGVAIYVQGYEKKSNCITGKIETLGLYEVSKFDIQKYEIAESDTVLHNGLESIPLVLKGDCHFDYGYDQIDELTSFYSNIPEAMGGWGMRSEGDTSFIIMFEASRILKIVTRLLEIFNTFSSFLNSKDSEQEELLSLKKALESASAQNGIVELFYG